MKDWSGNFKLKTMKSGKLLRDIPIGETCSIEDLGGTWTVKQIGETHTLVENEKNPDNKLNLPNLTPLK